MLKEITIQDVVDIFSKTDIIDAINSKYYFEIIFKHILNFYDNPKEESIDSSEDQFYGLTCFLNDEYKNKWYSNIYNIKFENLLTNNIFNLFDKNEIKFNYPCFISFCKFLLLNEYYFFLNYNSLNIHKFICNIYCSVMNGIGIKCDNKQLITESINDFYKILIKKFAKQILYIDSNFLYINKVDTEIINELNKLNIPYSIFNENNINIIRQKQYIEIDKNANTKFKGFRIDKSGNLKDKSYEKYLPEITRKCREIKLKSLHA